MQIVPSFEGNGSPYGAFRVLAPYPETNSRNSSHYQELYQNLPQLQKAIVLPVAYKPYETQNPSVMPISYTEQAKPTAISPFYNRLHSSGHHKYHHGKHLQEQDIEQLLNKRTGYGYGYAEAPAHHEQHNGSSPALSALALLGFMFFLQLIQNSLQNNRQMLAAAALNATTATVAGRGNKYLSGNRRQKRSTPKKKGIPKSTDYIYDVKNQYTVHSKELINNYQQDHATTTTIPPPEIYNFISSPPLYKQIRNNKVKKPPSDDLIETLRSSSIQCCQLIACKIGETIYDKLDKTTGFMVRMLGATMIPRIPKTSWTGRLLRAVDKGWKKESCDNLYRNCGALYKLLYSTTQNTSESRGKRKYFNKRNGTAQ